MLKTFQAFSETSLQNVFEITYFKFTRIKKNQLNSEKSTTF